MSNDIDILAFQFNRQLREIVVSTSIVNIAAFLSAFRRYCTILWWYVRKGENYQNRLFWLFSSGESASNL